MYKKSYNRILEFLFDKPTYKFHIREMARLTGLNPNTISNNISILKKQGMIIVKKREHVLNFSANLKNKIFLRKKRISNLNKLYDLSIVDFLAENLNPDSISIIGSYSRGEDIEKSDVDIVVITKDKSKRVVDLIKFEKIIKRPIHLIITNNDEMSDEFYNNLINGVVLYGYLRKK